MDELVFKGENNQALTSSLLVAEKFGKEHKHVLDAVREAIRGCAENSADPMFVETTYISVQNGQEYPMYVMNEDGFTLIAMGFTGKKAFKFKLDFIAAFRDMKNKLKEIQKPLSHLEILVQSAQALLEHENRIANVEQRLNAMEQERMENGRLLLSVSVSSDKTPVISLRDKVRQLVNTYSSALNIKQQDVWHKIYSQLYYLYHISVKAYKKDKKETYLDVAERNMFLDKIYIIASNMVRENKIA